MSIRKPILEQTHARTHALTHAHTHTHRRMHVLHLPYVCSQYERTYLSPHGTLSNLEMCPSIRYQCRFYGRCCFDNDGCLRWLRKDAIKRLCVLEGHNSKLLLLSFISSCQCFLIDRTTRKYQMISTLYSQYLCWPAVFAQLLKQNIFCPSAWQETKRNNLLDSIDST